MTIRVQIEAIGPDLAACAARFSEAATQVSEQLELLVPAVPAMGNETVTTRLVVEGNGRAVAHVTVKP